MNIQIFSKKDNQKHTLETLSKFGIAVIPDYLNKQEIHELLKEFEDILDVPESNFKKNISYSNGKGAILIREEIKSNQFTTTQKIFSDSYMKKIKDEFWGKDSYLNKKVFVVNDVVGSKHHANDLHFDVKPTFKFFIYLTDTTIKNGAFSCVPGSHKLAAEIRKKLGRNISYENRELSRNLPVTEEDVIPIEGKAGTLIIFTTEVFHRAGIVSEGDRKVMRGHCRSPKQEQIGNGANPIRIFLKKLKSLIKI